LPQVSFSKHWTYGPNTIKLVIYTTKLSQRNALRGKSVAKGTQQSRK
jgi:hypothetical protein